MKIKFIAPTLLSILLVACGSSKDATNSNFEKAANVHFSKNCISLQPSVFSAQNKSYPLTVALQTKNNFIKQEQLDNDNANTTRGLDLLVKAGVLSVQDGTKKEIPLFEKVEVVVPTKIYSLTEMGKKSLEGEDSTTLCIGHYKVDEVVRFSQPNNAFGQTYTEVNMTISPVDVPNWVENEDLQKFYNLNQALVKHKKTTRGFVLASDGWIDERDFSK